jgi:hypothetical protein
LVRERREDESGKEEKRGMRRGRGSRIQRGYERDKEGI